MSNVRRFGAAGDGTTDDTAAVRHALRDGDGMLHFPPGTYLISQTIEVLLADRGPCGIDGTSGTARILMSGPGPAFRFIGTHGGTGNPASFKGNVFPTQRLPTIQNIEIEGVHPEADGIELVQTMQALFEGVLIRRCRHGMHLVQRNRNVLISHCHVYHCSGVGVFLDGVNLHQVNIAGSHISYNRLGGVRIERSEVRNLQITGNDIEYNNHEAHGTEPEPTAEISIDTSAPGASVCEVTIASNTIQATSSPGGCNIRIIDTRGGKDLRPNLWAITGNIIGSQETNVHLTGCHGMTITGNCIYSCSHRNLLIEDSQFLNLSGNVFRRHTPTRGTGVRIEGSHDIAFTGCTIHDEHESGQESGASLLELVDCERINISGCQLLGGVPCGIDATNCSGILVTGCTIHDSRPELKSRHAVRLAGAGRENLIATNHIGATVDFPLAIGPETEAEAHSNVLP
ncbi:MAG: right-handed parallel beta-helix repeat-containing protein [Planctomycetaceae bacterium]|nr:right-handed parallel beta-helix repeat-containing protein [Planctomycetaceae bacterium]